jgi:hypothetical protein
MDYDKVAGEVDGAILRVAYGNRKDREFETHYKNFSQRGVPLGVYHYLVEYVSAQDQINAFIEYITDVASLGNGWGEVLTKKFQMGTWTDVELENGAPALTANTVHSYINGLETITQREVGIYSSRYYWDAIMKTDRYKSRKFWVAHYGAAIPLLPITGGWDNWWMWQHTTNFILQGYNNFYNGQRVGVDGNHFWGNADDFNEWVGEIVIPPPPVPSEPLYQVEVTASALNVRSQPYVQPGNIIGGLYDGDIVDVYGESSGWLKIDYNGNVGWISGYYTRRVEEPPTKPEPTYQEKLDLLWSIHPELH